MSLKNLLLLAVVFSAAACSKFDELKDHFDDKNKGIKEDPSNFKEIGSVDIGNLGAAEISAYDPKTKRLFVVNNSDVNKIDVLDFSNPTQPIVMGNISMAPYGGAVNSVDVKDGLLAAAIESTDRQQPGKVVVFRTTDYGEVKVIPVGALPDMITYSPDGKYILTANEGEPNTTYLVDPPGTVSIISVKDNYSVTALDFAAFASQQAALKNKGLRVYGPNASFPQDMEPEYVTVSADSRTAWATLQENNAVARIDIRTRRPVVHFGQGQSLEAQPAGGFVRKRRRGESVHAGRFISPNYLRSKGKRNGFPFCLCTHPPA